MLATRLATGYILKVRKISPTIRLLSKNQFNLMSNNDIIMKKYDYSIKGPKNYQTSYPIQTTRYYSNKPSERDMKETKEKLIHYTFKTIAFAYDVAKLAYFQAVKLLEWICNNESVKKYMAQFKKKLEEARKK